MLKQLELISNKNIKKVKLTVIEFKLNIFKNNQKVLNEISSKREK